MNRVKLEEGIKRVFDEEIGGVLASYYCKKKEEPKGIYLEPEKIVSKIINEATDAILAHFDKVLEEILPEKKSSNEQNNLCQCQHSCCFNACLSQIKQNWKEMNRNEKG
jgi:hypothetical protein